MQKDLAKSEGCRDPLQDASLQALCVSETRPVFDTGTEELQALQELRAGNNLSSSEIQKAPCNGIAYTWAIMGPKHVTRSLLWGPCLDPKSTRRLKGRAAQDP